MNPPRYAGFWRRAGAHAIDTLIFLPVIGVLLFLVYGADYFLAAQQGSVRGFGDFALNYVLPAVVVVLLWARFGATPGKALLHCKIVSAATLQHPTLGQSVARYIGYVLSLLPLGLGFWWIAWDGRKQGFHDKIAGTTVLVIESDDAGKSLAELMKEGNA